MDQATLLPELLDTIIKNISDSYLFPFKFVSKKWYEYVENQWPHFSTGEQIMIAFIHGSVEYIRWILSFKGIALKDIDKRNDNINRKLFGDFLCLLTKEEIDGYDKKIKEKLVNMCALYGDIKGIQHLVSNNVVIPKKSISYGLECGYEIVKYLKTNTKFIYDSDIMNDILETNNKEIIELFIKCQVLRNIKTNDTLIKSLFRYCNPDIIERIFKNKKIEIKDEYIQKAIVNGNLQVVHWAINKKKYDIRNINSQDIYESNSLSVIKWYHEMFPKKKLDFKKIIATISFKELDKLLEWLDELEIKNDTLFVNKLESWCIYGNSLQKIVERGYVCDINSSLLYLISDDSYEENCKNILWLYEIGANIDFSIGNELITNNDINFVNKLVNLFPEKRSEIVRVLYRESAAHYNTYFIKLLIMNGYPMPDKYGEHLLKRGLFNVMFWCIKNNYVFNVSSVSFIPINYLNLKIIKQLIEIKNARIIIRENDFFSILFQNKCKVVATPSVTNFVYQKGDIELFKHFISNQGYIWAETIKTIIKHEDLDLLKWINDNYNKNNIDYSLYGDIAFKTKNKELINWLVDKL